MLVLSRRENEVIYIGGIAVRVCRIKGCSVRLGIEAPPEVPVHRGEILSREELSRIHGVVSPSE